MNKKPPYTALTGPGSRYRLNMSITLDGPRGSGRTTLMFKLAAIIEGALAEPGVVVAVLDPSGPHYFEKGKVDARSLDGAHRIEIWEPRS